MTRGIAAPSTALLLAVAGCTGTMVSGDDTAGRGDAGGHGGTSDGGAFDGATSDGGPSLHRDAGGPPPRTAEGWPEPNEWSWDGSWTPSDGSFPLEGLLDDEYFDGHPGRDGSPTPILPPGEWDWDDASDDLANWRNFETNLGRFEQLRDSMDRHYGWRFVGNETNVDYSGAADYFEGSSGPDLLDLGPGGAMHSFGGGNLADGPDVLIFDRSWSLDFRTGSTDRGGLRDDDLVIAGCGDNPDGSFDIETTTIHTGPGHDWVFARDLSRAGIDLGNGDGGRTDTVDPLDGDDLAVIRGNAHDFRVVGGARDDVFVWYVDEEVQTTTYLGPNFFGNGQHGAALWDGDGTDRLVLVVPVDTELVTSSPTPPGGLLVRGTSGELILDGPTQDDVYARYCVECGTGPGGRKTVILEYRSRDESVFTGYFYLTAVEELQVGVGEGARVYRIDDVAGRLVPDDSLEAFVPPVPGDSYCR